MLSKEHALSEIVTLARAHELRSDEIASALAASGIHAPVRREHKSFPLAQVLAWMGGIVAFYGLVLVAVSWWDEMTIFDRVAINYLPGLACYLLATRALLHPEKHRLGAQGIGVLVILSALLQGLGLYIPWLDAPEQDAGRLLAWGMVFAALTLQYGAVFFRVRHRFYLFFTLLFGVVTLLSFANFLHISGILISAGIGIGLIIFCSWLRRFPNYWNLCEFWYLVGGIMVLLPLQALQNSKQVEIHYNLRWEIMAVLLLTGLIILGMLYLSTVVRSVTLLAVSIVGLFIYGAYVIEEKLWGTIAWPVALILLGAMFLGVSAVVLALKRRFASTHTV